MGGIFLLVLLALAIGVFIKGLRTPKVLTTTEAQSGYDQAGQLITQEVVKEKGNSAVRRLWFWGGFGGVIIFGVIFGSMLITSVDEGEVHVPIQFGEAQEPLTNPGINFKSPFAGVVVMPTRTVELTFKGGVASTTTEEGETALGQINALSAEGAQVGVDVTVLYHIDPTMTAEVYRTVGTLWEDTLVIPRVRSSVRDCTTRYNFEEARTSKRGEASACILEAMQNALAIRGIVIEDSLLRDMRAGAQLQAAIDEKLEAQSNAQRAEFVQREAVVTAETKVIEAEGAANAAIELARGQAEAIRLKAAADADANDLIAASLTADLLQLRIFEELGDKTVVVTDGISPLPLLPIEVP